MYGSDKNSSVKVPNGSVDHPLTQYAASQGHSIKPRLCLRKTIRQVTQKSSVSERTPRISEEKSRQSEERSVDAAASEFSTLEKAASISRKKTCALPPCRTPSPPFYLRNNVVRYVSSKLLYPRLQTVSKFLRILAGTSP